MSGDNGETQILSVYLISCENAVTLWQNVNKN